LLVAASIIAPLVGLLVLDYRYNFGLPGIWVWPLVLVFAGLGTAEFLDLLAAQNLRPPVWSVYAGTLFVLSTGLVPVFWPLSGSAYPASGPWGQLALPLIAVVISVALAFLAEMRRYREPGGCVVRVALAVLGVVYVGLMTTFLIALRLYHDNAWGMTAVVSLLFVTKMSDTGAYAFGRTFGRHKLTPILSPKKTVEGFVGGLVTAAGCSYLYFHVMLVPLVGPDAKPPTWWACLAYGTIVALAGVLGDLSESLLKRDAGRKDSSRWVPGLGGILDVLDSLLLAAPAGYFCWASGMLGP
jgi:phosphatidate cytidylyltransferase